MASQAVPPPRSRRFQRCISLTRRPAVLRTGLVVLALIAWDLLTRLGLVQKLFVSSPIGVVTGFRSLFKNPNVGHAFQVTGSAILIAFIVGTFLGLLAGLAIGLSRLMRDAYYEAVLFLLGTPKAVFIPIFLLVFGTAHTAAAFGAFEAFFYVVVNVVGGVDLVEQRHRMVARAFGAGLWHTFQDVILPGALPGIFASFWYGIKQAFLGVLIVELYISAGGLGQVILQYTNLLETNQAFAIILVVSVVAILIGVAWTKMETRLLRWDEGADPLTRTGVS